MSKCKKIRNMMSLYIDGELNEQQLKEFNCHIKKCKSCKEELKFLQSIVTTCNNFEEEKLPDDFQKKLHDNLVQVKQDSNRVPWYRNWKIYSGIAACILLVFILKDSFFNYLYRADNAYVADISLPQTKDKCEEEASALPRNDFNSTKQTRSIGRSAKLAAAPPYPTSAPGDPGNHNDANDSSDPREAKCITPFSVECLEDGANSYIIKKHINILDNKDKKVLTTIKDKSSKYIISDEQSENKLIIEVAEKNFTEIIKILESLNINYKLDETTDACNEKLIDKDNSEDSKEEEMEELNENVCQIVIEINK